MSDEEIIEPADDPTALAETEPVEAELVPYDEAAPEPEPAPTPPPPAYRGTGISWSYLFGSLLTVAIIILAAQNTESVEFEFLTWSITAPLAAVILASAFIAVVIDELIGVIWRFRRRRQLRMKAELKQYKAQTEPEKKRFRR